MAFESLIAYKYTILFYGLLFLFIYLNRKKFETHAKIIFLYRTSWGIKLMEKIAKKAGKYIKPLSIVGIYIGFIGMLFIIFLVLQGVYSVLFIPDAPPTVVPVIPGVPIPGSPIQVPLVVGWLALFIVVVIHEFSHGVVSKTHKIPVKSSGILFFGPLGGAFVEPDENKLKREKPQVQNAIFAAGPFSNVLTAGIFFLILTFIASPAMNTLVSDNGVLFDNVFPDKPAYQAGIRSDIIYTHINNREIKNYSVFTEELKATPPGNIITLSNEKGEHPITTIQHPDNASISFIGITPGIILKNPDLSWIFAIVLFLTRLSIWILILSLGLGLANLLPLGPVDGGRMLQTTLGVFFGKKKGNKIWAKVTSVFILILIILLFPIFKEIFLALFGFLL